MIDDKIDTISQDQTVKYVVFPCEKCGKWTYAKADQKARKCGICQKNHVIAALHEFEPADNVAKAAKLAQEKNIGWQQDKGIQIAKPLKKSPQDQSPKSQPFFKSEDVKENNENKQYNLILTKIAKNVKDSKTPQPIPTGYLSILYDMYSNQFPSFARFLRYALNSKKISGDSFFGFSFP